MNVSIGVDFGRRKDVTAIVVVKHNNGRATVVDAEELANIPFPDQRARIAQVIRQWNASYVGCDESGMGGPVVEELQREFYSMVQGTTFTAPAKEDLVAKAQVMMKEGKLRFKRHPLR